jgi:hypothetical protein
VIEAVRRRGLPTDAAVAASTLRFASSGTPTQPPPQKPSAASQLPWFNHTPEKFEWTPFGESPPRGEARRQAQRDIFQAVVERNVAKLRELHASLGEASFMEAAERPSAYGNFAHTAATNGDVAMLKALSEIFGPEYLLATASGGINAAHAAAWGGSVEALKYLREVAGDDFVKATATEGGTHIGVLALDDGHVGVLEYAADALGDFMLQPVAAARGLSLVHFIALADCLPALRWFAARYGADALAQRSPGFGWSAANMAILSGSVDCLRFLKETVKDRTFVLDGVKPDNGEPTEDLRQLLTQSANRNAVCEYLQAEFGDEFLRRMDPDTTTEQATRTDDEAGSRRWPLVAVAVTAFAGAAAFVLGRQQ